MSGNLVVLRPLLSQTQPWWPMTSYAFLQWSFRGWSLDSGYPPLFLPIFPLKIEWSNRRSPNLRSPSSTSEWMKHPWHPTMAPSHGTTSSPPKLMPIPPPIGSNNLPKNSCYLGKNRLTLNVRNLTPVSWILCASSLLHHRTCTTDLGTWNIKYQHPQNSPEFTISFSL